jgi:hypothetical protein
MRSGIELEIQFLLQAKRDYDELNPQAANQQLDRHYATDVLLQRNGRVIPVALTRREHDWDKIERDWSKASKRWNHWVEVVVEQDSPEREALAIDNALEWLNTQYETEIKGKEKAFFLLVALAEGVVQTDLE